MEPNEPVPPVMPTVEPLIESAIITVASPRPVINPMSRVIALSTRLRREAAVPTA